MEDGEYASHDAYVSVCVWGGGYVQVSEEADDSVGSPAAAATGSHGLPDLAAGNGTLFLWEDIK